MRCLQEEPLANRAALALSTALYLKRRGDSSRFFAGAAPALLVAAFAPFGLLPRQLMSVDVIIEVFIVRFYTDKCPLICLIEIEISDGVRERFITRILFPRSCFPCAIIFPIQIRRIGKHLFLSQAIWL